MNNKTTLGIIASIAIFLGAFGILGVSDLSFNEFKIEPSFETSNTYQQTEKTLYGPSGVGSFIVTDPLKVTDRTSLMVKGTIVEIEDVTKYWNEYAESVPKESSDVRAEIKMTFYTVQINNVLKGNYTDDIITIRSMFGTHVNYQAGDQIIAMLSSENGDITPNSGPYGMYKIKNGDAIGHEKTLPEKMLLDRAESSK